MICQITEELVRELTRYACTSHNVVLEAVSPTSQQRWLQRTREILERHAQQTADFWILETRRHEIRCASLSGLRSHYGHDGHMLDAADAASTTLKDALAHYPDSKVPK
jgi:hypothetical protein